MKTTFCTAWLSAIILLFWFGSASAEEGTQNKKQGTQHGCDVDNKSDPTKEKNQIKEENEINNAVDFGGMLDNFLCPVDKDDWAMRTLRAQIVINMFARYGAARIPHYSRDKVDEDARRLLLKIEASEKSMADFLEAYDDKNPTHHEDFTELQFNIIEVFEAAVEPTTRNAKRWFLSSLVDKVRDGKRMLINIVRDRQFLGAYRAELGDILKITRSHTDPAVLEKIWDFVLKKTEKSCNKLRALTTEDGNAMECTKAIRDVIFSNKSSENKEKITPSTSTQ